MQVVAKELGEYYNKDPREIDADTLVPYLVYVIIKGVADANQEQLSQRQDILESDSPVIYT